MLGPLITGGQIFSLFDVLLKYKVAKKKRLLFVMKEVVVLVHFN